MKTFLTSLTLKGKLLLGAAVLLFVIAIAAGLYYSGKRKGENVVENAKEAGAVVQREGDLRETLDRTEQANEARQAIREAIISGAGPDPVLYDQCLRTARTPANCERFLPRSEADQR